MRRASLWLIIVGILANLVTPFVEVSTITVTIGLVVFLISILARVRKAHDVDALVVDPPISGQWLPIDSPRMRIPSTGTSDFGQSYALVLVHDPEDSVRPQFGNDESGLFLPDRFPGFGEPVFAMSDGVVIKLVRHRRDHRSRSRWGVYIFMLTCELLIRVLSGTSSRIGNHIVVRVSDGSHLVYAHLKHKSTSVSIGEKITKGQTIAECGLSGWAPEPQLLVQRQDCARPMRARGLPWSIKGAGVDGSDGLPPTRQVWDVNPHHS